MEARRRTLLANANRTGNHSLPAAYAALKAGGQLFGEKGVLVSEKPLDERQRGEDKTVHPSKRNIEAFGEQTMGSWAGLLNPEFIRKEERGRNSSLGKVTRKSD